MTRYERKLFFEKLLALRATYRTETHAATDTTIETVTAFAEQAYKDAAAREAMADDPVRRQGRPVGRLRPNPYLPLPQDAPGSPPPGRSAVQADPSSVTTHAARTRAHASTSASGTDSSAPWASRTSPGPKITHGVSPSLTNRRMSAPYGTPTSDGRSPVTRAATPARPAGSSWSEATLADAKRAPVISTSAGCSLEERVVGAGGRDARPQLGLRRVGRLAEANAVAALGDDPVHDRRRPLAAGDRADDRRVGHARGRSSTARSPRRCAASRPPRGPAGGGPGCRARTRPRGGGSRGPRGPGP